MNLMKKLSLYIFLVLMWCNVALASEFCDGFKKGLSIDNGYENEISFGIEYAKGTRAYFFINREKSAMIIHIFTYFTLKQKGELFKIMDKKVEENLKNSKHPYDKVIGIVVHHAIENFSENYLGKAVGKCR